MHQVKADLDRQLLHITLTGYLKADAMVAAADAVIEEASKLGPGYTVVTDISEFKPADAGAAAEIKRVMDYLATHQAKRAILVTGGKGSGKLQFDRMRRQVETGYEVIYVETLAEADIYLEP